MSFDSRKMYWSLFVAVLIAFVAHSKFFQIAPFFDEHLIWHLIVLFSDFILFKFYHFFQIFILFRRISACASNTWIKGLSLLFAKRSFILLFWIGDFDKAKNGSRPNLALWRRLMSEILFANWMSKEKEQDCLVAHLKARRLRNLQCIRWESTASAWGKWMSKILMKSSSSCCSTRIRKNTEPLSPRAAVHVRRRTFPVTSSPGIRKITNVAAKMRSSIFLPRWELLYKFYFDTYFGDVKVFSDLWCKTFIFENKCVIAFLARFYG